MELNESFWTERYKNGQTGWDIGYVSTPLKEYIDQIEDKELKILIPGAGNAYEAEYLFEHGFTKVTVIDISAMPLEALKSRIPEKFHENLIQVDFFEFEGQFDLIIEQTFFSAINPSLRHRYAEHMLSLLKPGGKLVGVLFDAALFEDHPPFGGNKEVYLQYFQDRFQIKHLERCYNSIPPRQGMELFLNLIKN